MILVLLSFSLFAVLTTLVATGAMTGLDQSTVDHAMIWVTRGRERSPSLLETAFPLFSRADNADHVAAAFVSFVARWPASALPATALFTAACGLLFRRGRRRAAAVWGTAWVTALAAELIAKHTVQRPALSFASEGFVNHISGLDAAYPSGHAMRAVLLGALIASLAPRLWVPLLVWIGALAVTLVLAGVHTTTDVVGGLALGVGFAALANRAARGDGPVSVRSRPARAAEESSSR